MLKTLMTTTLVAGFAALASVAAAENYPTPVPLNDGAIVDLKRLLGAPQGEPRRQPFAAICSE